MFKTLLVLLLTLGVFLSPDLVSQEMAIKMIHKKGSKERLLKEGKRVRVRTVDGEKYKGRFTIVDQKTIAINDQRIALHTIQSIRRKPLAVKIVKSVFIIAGTIALVAPLVLSVDPIATWGFIGLGIYANIVGFAVPEFFVQTRSNVRWNYAIVPI